ncbi:16S rRNA (uracil(1498)-N(3))-methyltransferase [Rhodoferax fermentans]|uniref:Ribosomal RNA small subunit methyltransferase E n=1 Tax=Rhodoferax fermentans TaxID=28066 RepID=A0A1T1AS30_RHOFE|nr:16S rRNA (uracil(1498)-N(3))-methyltransferase [Rhodoferax fermentans]MBK1683716.1 16S rRNA (uracil(1498)-N(3))-methyltransferase [Rhodoferax fermentans]OOV06922.1 16S rRNA (uracil(1498)-N(3))-methyltransferase [Rhodoferax fermentans]
MPRFYCPTPLHPGALLELPAGAARHVQVLRLQPGDGITLFTGDSSGEYSASVTQMGRSHVQVQVGDYLATQREPALRVHLVVGMPANERMDWLVEKATELGVASIQPLMTERSVLRLSGERADKKVAHWHSVAVAACEQCGGNRVPVIHPVATLAQWLPSHTERVAAAPAAGQPLGLLLSLAAGARAVREAVVPRLTQSANSPDIHFLSGPEGGLSPAEEAAALQAGLNPVTLGPRVLRAETAALAALSALLV